MTALTQRWRDGSHRWRRASEGGFEPDRYSVTEVDEPAAASFVRRHHYSASWPAAKLRYALREGDGPLVGVIVLGVPMSAGVLTRPFPTLEPYTESLELSRLILLDQVPANAESWFCAEAFRRAAARGVRGVVAFSDPQPRWRTTCGTRELVKPGHCGIVYQALNFSYLGRGTRRTLVLLPDATVLSARAMAKVTGGERGRDGVVLRLTALGAAPLHVDQNPREWLRAALCAVGAVRQSHRGNHRYALRIGRNRAERSRVAIGMPGAAYPKPAGTASGGAQ